MPMKESHGNMERKKVLKKIWRQKNKDKIRVWKLKWATSENGKASQRRYRAKSAKAMRFLYISSAKKRGLIFDISEELFQKIINKDCVYCGQSAKPKRNGIDRIDNMKGYIKGNIVPCCFVCNQMKGRLSIDKFMNHIIRILEHGTK